MDLVEAAQAESATAAQADTLGVWAEDNPTTDGPLDWEEVLPAPVFKTLGDWHDDSFYLDIFKQDQQHKQALAEAARQKKLQAQAQAAKAVPVAAPPRPEVKPKPAKLTKAEAAIGGQNFNGTHFPTLTISAMPPVHFELVTDTFRLEQVIDKLMLEPMISVDTETNGLDPYANKLLLVQIATPEMSYVIDPNKVNNGPLRRLLENERILKLFHNAKFDYKMLKHHIGVTVNNIYDSYLAERLITAGLGAEANLKAVVKKYLNEEMDKAVRGTFVGLNNIDRISKEQLEYAARDTLALFPVYTKQMERMRSEKLVRVADLEFQCVTAVGDLELAGCKIDTEKWRGILKDVAAKRDAARDELMNMLPGGNTRQASMFGGDEYMINLNSGHQIMSEFRKLGVELEDTSEATLSRHNHPAIKLLLEYRGHEKTLGSFGEGLLAMIKPQTGRIHPDFLQYGADTGRFSCANPNVQQIPASSDFRSCFIAEEGYKLITCDYSQAELRILADLSQDAAFLEAFRSGGDLHKLAASQMFQVPVDQVSKEQRSQAKAINFGLAYGMGPQGLAVRIDKTVDEARALIDAYFKAFNGVQRWLQKAGRDSIRTLNSPTPLGRKRYYHALDPEDPDYRKKVSDIDRRGKNAPIQGANADMTKMALIYIREKLKGYDARTVNTVHDEIVVEVREDQAEVVCKIVEHEMIRAGEDILKSVPIVADAKIGDYWAK